MQSSASVFRASLHVRCALVLAFGLFALPAYAFAGEDNVPDWVRTAVTQTHPLYSRETTAVVLLDETTLTVSPDGHATEHRRRIVKILRPEGRDEGTVFLSFNKDTKILSLHVWSIGPDGHEYAVKGNEISEHGYPGEGILYDDDRYRQATPPGRDPGGVVAYEYEQRVSPYINEKTWYFQQDIPHIAQSFTLELPPGFTYGTVWAHHEKQNGMDFEHGRFRWEMNNVPGIDLDEVPMRPSEFALAGRMTVHYAPPGASGASLDTWQGIGEWYNTLARDRLAPTPDMAAKAKELTAGKTDFYDKTEAIAEFVQLQVRYFVIEMGIGGYQPHPAADIFRNRYGDCKDKATLLSTMLSTVGIHAALMMVDHRRGVVDPAAPSIVGDHMIAAVEIPSGYSSPHLRSVITAKSGKRYLIVDPTSEKTPFGQLEHQLQGGYGVLFEPNTSEIVELPLLDPQFNTVRRTATFQLKPDGSLGGSVVEKRFGDLAELKRNVYTTRSVQQQDLFEDRTLGQDFTTFHTRDYKVENVSSLNRDLTTSFSLVADGFGKFMGQLLMVRPRVLGTDALFVDHKPRTVPIDLNETRREDDDFTIELPEGYAMDELPQPVKLDLGFAAYESSTVLSGNTLHYHRTYTVRELTLPASRYPDVQKLSSTIATDEQSRAVLKKK